MKSKALIKFNHLRVMYSLYTVEAGNYISLDYSKLLNYHEDRGVYGDICRNCLTGWSDISKTQYSWVRFFVLSHSKPTPTVGYERRNYLPHKVSFFYRS
jgi:hypothetical protein